VSESQSSPSGPERGMCHRDVRVETGPRTFPLKLTWSATACDCPVPSVPDNRDDIIQLELGLRPGRAVNSRRRYLKWSKALRSQIYRAATEVTVPTARKLRWPEP